jgi:hypothetical protein
MLQSGPLFEEFQMLNHKSFLKFLLLYIKFVIAL